jgi:protein-tyrosine phosphatase
MTTAAITPETAPERRLRLDGAHNLRDIGGYATHDGNCTRWRALYRADSLHRLTPADQRQLLDLGVRTVIDLRRIEELNAALNVFVASADVAYFHVSLVPEPPVSGARPVGSLEELNRRILEERQPELAAIFETLATPGRLPAVVHCTAGKDRTGLVIALLLSLVGVPDATIAEDYALTAFHIAPLLAELRAEAARAGHDLERFERMLRCRKETIFDSLAYVRGRHGDVRGYLRAIGLSPRVLGALRSSLVEGGDGEPAAA